MWGKPAILMSECKTAEALDDMKVKSGDLEQRFTCPTPVLSRSSFKSIKAGISTKIG